MSGATTTSEKRDCTKGSKEELPPGRAHDAGDAVLKLHPHRHQGIGAAQRKTNNDDIPNEWVRPLKNTARRGTVSGAGRCDWEMLLPTGLQSDGFPRRIVSSLDTLENAFLPLADGPVVIDFLIAQIDLSRDRLEGVFLDV